MTEAKTRPTGSSVDEYIASRASAEQLSDCEALLALLGRVSGEKPRMWGPSIVGFGSYRYPLASGKLGESCATGFAVRGKELVVYLVAEGRNQSALLAKLGKHRFGKACLYLKRLDDVDQRVLEQLVAGSLAELRRRSSAVDRSSTVARRTRSPTRVSVTGVGWRRPISVSAEKFAQVSRAILEVLTVEPIKFTELSERVAKRLPKFEGSVSWYTLTVARELEVQGKLVRRVKPVLYSRPGSTTAKPASVRAADKKAVVRSRRAKVPRGSR